MVSSPHLKKQAHLSFWLTKTNIEEVASDLHVWISVLEQPAEAGFKVWILFHLQ